MGNRIRRTSKTALTALIVVFALIGSAWLAAATTGPKGVTYPVTAERAKGAGVVGTNKHDFTAFAFDVARDSHGKLKGVVVIHCSGNPGQELRVELAHLAEHRWEHRDLQRYRQGSAAGGTGLDTTLKTPLTADVTAVDNHPDSITILVHNGATPVCSASGALSHGKIVVPVPVPSHGHGHKDK